MLDLALVLVFSLHLLAVDLAMAGPLISVWLEWSGMRRGDAGSAAVARRLASWSLAAGIVGIGLGLLALAVLPHFESEPYRRALGAVSPRRWWFAGWELLFYVCCLGAYIGPWQWFRRGRLRRVIHRGLAIVGATDLMYHFPPMFAVLSTISTRPALWGESLDNRPLFWRLLLEGETFSRVVHHWLAAVAVSAAAGMLLAGPRAILAADDVPTPTPAGWTAGHGLRGLRWGPPSCNCPSAFGCYCRCRR